MALLRICCATARLPLLRLLVPPLPSVLRNPTLLLPKLPVDTDATPMEALLASVTCDPNAKVAPPPVMLNVLVPGLSNALARVRLTSRLEAR